MTQYKKLILPQDSAWGRRTWRRYTPYWFNNFWDGVKNIIRWIPTIYKDKDWDDYFITKLLQKKIEYQRAYLVHHNRHMDIERDNRDMTWVLNLIERKHEEYYGTEHHDYQDIDMKFIPAEGNPEVTELAFETKSENLDAYLAKYPGSVKRVKKKYSGKDFSGLQGKQTLSYYVASFNQQRSNKLLWKIMEERSERWWD
jgi:hypothetical protein